MWVKQCDEPSPSQHHFYSWYMLVYIYIKTIPSHGGFIKPLFLATLNSHHLWPPQTAPSSVGRPRSKTSSTWLPETPLQSCEARSRSCSIWRMLGHVNTNIYFEKNIDILSMHICIYIYNHIYICMYVCMCESEILSDMYVPCWYWGDLLSLTTTGDSQLRHDGCFLGGPAVVLEPKGQQWWPFGTGRIRTIYMGTLWCCSLAPIRTPHAWPTSLITRKGVALNRSVTFAGIHLSNYGELKAHSELQIYDAACYDLYQKNLFTCTLTRCNLCTALRFIRSGVASMESHSSMEIKSKHEDDYGARSLPSRSFVSWDVDRCRNSAYHAMTF